MGLTGNEVVNALQQSAVAEMPDFKKDGSNTLCCWLARDQNPRKRKRAALYA